MFKFSATASFLLLFLFQIVTVSAQVALPAVTTLTSSVPGATGNVQITFACTGANYSHLWLDGKDLDQGYYTSKVVSTGPLTPGVDHSVLAYCWNPTGAGANKTIMIACGTGKNLVNGSCVSVPPAVTNLSSRVIDGTGNTEIKFSCTNANYSHLWLDGKDLAQGYYASTTVNTGALTPWVDHSVLAYCWNPAGAADSKTIVIPGCYKNETLNASGICEKNRVAKHDSSTLVNWFFSVPDINTLEFKVVVDNDPGKRADVFLQLYDTSIDGHGQYFGLQTNGKALFSRHTTADVSNADVPVGSTVVSNDSPLTNGEGFSHISLWRDLGLGGSLIAGTYIVKVTRGNYDGVGDWFRFYVTPPNGVIQYVGGLRFPRANASIPASFKDGAASWLEFWDNNAPDIVNGTSPAYQLADMSIHISPKVNGSVLYDGAIGHYSTSTPAFADAGNADIYQESSSTIRMIVGHSSIRVHQNTAFKCPTASKLVINTCVYDPPVVTALTSKVLDTTGNTQITFACTNANYSHLYIDGKDLDMGYYASKVVTTGALVSGSTHKVEAVCWNKDGGAYNAKTINFTATFIPTVALAPNLKTLANPMVLGDYATNLSCVDIPRNIHRGSESVFVTSLQSFFIEKGLMEGESTGFYGDKTVQAVKEYQISKGLPPTGMVYDFTRSAIKEDTCK